MYTFTTVKRHPIRFILYFILHCGTGLVWRHGKGGELRLLLTILNCIPIHFISHIGVDPMYFVEK